MSNSKLCASKHDLALFLPMNSKSPIHEHPNTMCDIEAQYQCLGIFGIGANSIPRSSMSTSKQSINDVLIVANRNYVPIDFIVLDINCNPTCPIILCRTFL